MYKSIVEYSLAKEDLGLNGSFSYFSINSSYFLLFGEQPTSEIVARIFEEAFNYNILQKVEFNSLFDSTEHFRKSIIHEGSFYHQGNMKVLIDIVESYLTKYKSVSSVISLKKNSVCLYIENLDNKNENKKENKKENEKENENENQSEKEKENKKENENENENENERTNTKTTTKTSQKKYIIFNSDSCMGYHTKSHFIEFENRENCKKYLKQVFTGNSFSNQTYRNDFEKIQLDVMRKRTEEEIKDFEKAPNSCLYAFSIKNRLNSQIKVSEIDKERKQEQNKNQNHNSSTKGNQKQNQKNKNGNGNGKGKVENIYNLNKEIYDLQSNENDGGSDADDEEDFNMDQNELSEDYKLDKIDLQFKKKKLIGKLDKLKEKNDYLINKNKKLSNQKVNLNLGLNENEWQLNERIKALEEENLDLNLEMGYGKVARSFYGSKCPKCFYFSKAPITNFLQCQQCKTGFCRVCGRTIEKSEIWNHFFAEGSQCRLYL